MGGAVRAPNSALGIADVSARHVRKQAVFDLVDRPAAEQIGELAAARIA
jgi:hypothetical protein